MDFVTGVLMQAAIILGSKALEESARISVREGWDALKEAIKRKFGTSSHAATVMEELPAAASIVAELPPANNDAVIGSLAHRLQGLKLEADSDLQALVQRLDTILKSSVPANALQAASTVVNRTIYAKTVLEGANFNAPVTFN